MTTPAFTTTDIVNFAAKKDAVNLATAFNDLVSQRMYGAIDARKREVANQMFNGAQDEQELEAMDGEDQVAAEISNDTEQEEHSEESDENAQETN